MQLRRRVGRASTLSYLAYIIVLVGTISLAVREAGLGIERVNLFGLANVLFVITIFTLITLRGLIVRVRYSLFLAVLTVLFTLIPLFFLGHSFIAYLIPLLVVSLISVALLLRDYRYYNFPTRLFNRPEITISIVIIVIVLLVGVLGTLILGDQFRPRITNASMALYYTGEVVTTLGFGDILPITRTSQLFSIAMSILGIGSFFGAVTVIVGPLIYERGRRVVRVIQKLENRVMENYVLFVDFNPLLKSLLDALVERDELIIVALEDREKGGMIKHKGVFVEIDESVEKIMSGLDLRNAKRIILGSGDDGKNIINALFILSKYPGEDMKAKMVSFVNISSNASRMASIVGGTIDPAALIAEHSRNLIV